MLDNLRTILSDWDAKRTEPLEAAFRKFHSDPEFLQSLVDLCEVTSCQSGATWLLKHHFDTTGTPMTPALTGKHLSTLHRIEHWEAELHIFQYLERLDIPADAEDTLDAFVENALSSKNKLVRAWAFYGLAVVATRFSAKKTLAFETLTAAQAVEPAASVKVRIRKALEKLSK